MKATYSNKSWEKQTIWKLENGWTVTEEWNQHYGPYFTRMDSPDGKTWLASNGEKADFYNEAFGHKNYINLPEFAAEWKTEKGLVYFLFEKIYKNHYVK